jgi:hypothetical protein
MGFLKGTVSAVKAVNKAMDKSAEWAADRSPRGKVVMSTKNDTRSVSGKGSHQCAGGCGRKAQITKGGVRLCGRSGCDS